MRKSVAGYRFLPSYTIPYRSAKATGETQNGGPMEKQKTKGVRLFFPAPEGIEKREK